MQATARVWLVGVGICWLPGHSRGSPVVGQDCRFQHPHCPARQD